jgi:CRISPR-associated protein Csm2
MERRFNQKPTRNWANEFEESWIKEGITKECIEYTKDFGKFLAFNRLSTSQIRNVYGELKRIQLKGYDNEKTSFLLLRPKMAYADKRNEKDGLSELKKVFDKSYLIVENKIEFKNLMDFMESTLAYHKAYGGK